MTTLIINERTAKGKKLLRFLVENHSSDFIQIDKKPNKETIRAIEDSRKGKVTRTKNVSDLIKKLNE